MGVFAECLWLTRIQSRPVYVLIMASARVAGLSMPTLLLMMIPADTNLCEGATYINDDYELRQSINGACNFLQKHTHAHTRQTQHIR